MDLGHGQHLLKSDMSAADTRFWFLFRVCLLCRKFMQVVSPC
jgi:hypothetical protein